MNILDLPKDVLQIINRKVKDDYIIKRRLERKENRKKNRDQREKADKRRKIEYMWNSLSLRKIDKVQFDIENKKHIEDWNFLKKLQKKVESSILKVFITEIIPVIGGDKPFLEVYIFNIYTNKIERFDMYH